MKRAIILTIGAIFVVFMACTSSVFAETVTIEHTDHGEDAPLTVTVDDPEHFDKQSDWKIKTGAEWEGIITFTDYLRIDVAGKKQLNDTNFEEGWEGEGMLVFSKPLVDFRDIFKK